MGLIPFEGERAARGKHPETLNEALAQVFPPRGHENPIFLAHPPSRPGALEVGWV